VTKGAEDQRNLGVLEMRLWQVGALVVAISFSSLGANACSVSDIDVRQGSWLRVGDSVRIRGHIYNGCPDAVGVEVEATVRNKANQIIILAKFWPSNMSNIPGKNEYLFEWLASSVESADTVPETMTLRATDVRHW